MDRLGYVILFVRNLAASIHFYRDMLGVPFRFQNAGYAEFATRGVKLGLFERGRLPELLGPGAGPSAPEPRRTDPTGEILFIVNDVDSEADRLRAAGVDVLSGPIDRPWGHRTLHIADPDGHVAELAQEIPRTRSRG